MPQRGDIVVERLTGRRAVVIRVVGSEEVTCRFGDGRLEDRYTFELESAVPLLQSLLSLVLSLFVSPARPHPTPVVSERVRPLLVRPSGSS
jgi:hypothetical protein